MRTISAIKILRVMLSVTFALWMAGAGCLLGCENNIASAAHPAAAQDDLTLMASGDACASAHSSDCCAKHKAKPAAKLHHASNVVNPPLDSSLPQFDSQPRSMMENCPLAVNASAALTKAKPDLAPDSLHTAEARLPLPMVEEQTTPFSIPLRLPNRGHTYLRCCVFLI